MTNRCRYDLIHDTLVIMTTPVNITKVMYGANLAFPQLKAIREELLSKGLATVENDLWSITEKGRTLVYALEQVKGLIA